MISSSSSPAVRPCRASKHRTFQEHKSCALQISCIVWPGPWRSWPVDCLSWPKSPAADLRWAAREEAELGLAAAEGLEVAGPEAECRVPAGCLVREECLVPEEWVALVLAAACRG